MRVRRPRLGGSSRLRVWKRLALTALGLAGLLLVGAALLFSGSNVTCAEGSSSEGLELRCDFAVAATPEAVWNAFTRTGEPRAYYFDAVLQAELTPGGRWRFVTDDLERLLASGEVLAVDPPYRFEQSFEAADLDDPPSRITVELRETAADTRITLVHDRFPRETATFRRFRRAHPLALSALKVQLETGDLPVRASIYTVIFKPGMKLFTVRAEPWHQSPTSPESIPPSDPESAY